MFHYDIKKIRNISIIAHIDHGKSTLADRLLEITHTIAPRDMQEQVLDEMELEREKGITIKSHPVTMFYQDGPEKIYQINLLDTPGHVDFTYEVSRSLAACEGALLVIDASQGVQAQTVANVHLALEKNLEIIPIINKIDLPTAETEEVKKQIEDIIGLDSSRVILCSAKKGIGTKQILERIVQDIPPPQFFPSEPLRALIFDSHYNTYRGVLVYLRVISGEIQKGSHIYMMTTEKSLDVLEVGIFTPHEKPVDKLRAGEVGYFIGNIKNTCDVKIGDTITLKKLKAPTPLPGFRYTNPVVFAGIYPIESLDFEALHGALLKLQLNDAALHIEQEKSSALGLGFRCGFLGLLHLEITLERLKRDFDLDVISTYPSVIYKIRLTDDTMKEIDNPALFPDPSSIKWIEEPWMKCTIMVPSEYLGGVMNLAMEKRGICLHTENPNARHIILTYRLPLNEILTDFSDKLKSITKGYGSYDPKPNGYEKGDIVKVEIRINEKPVDAFSLLVHKTKAEAKGRAICEKLKEVIPRQLFKVPIQAAIGGKIVARETLSALAKNVTAKCYGGDITRKHKLWEKQKKGKKKMKKIGEIKIPQQVFLAVLKVSE